MSVNAVTDNEPQDSPELAALREKVAGTNIGAQTLLATDYLNHFNEIIMLLEMVPDMPELIEEVRGWTPKSYQDHFRDSAFSDRDLAITAYDHAPAKYRDPFDICIAKMDEVMLHAIKRSVEMVEGGAAPEELHHFCDGTMLGMQKLIDFASAIIHGSDRVLDQSEIDSLLKR